MGMVLGKFHRRVANRLTVRQPHRVLYEVWFYPLLEDAI